jgi:hypothetical protein
VRGARAESGQCAAEHLAHDRTRGGLLQLLFKRPLVDQTCISCQRSCVSSLHRAKGSLSCVSPEWKYGLGGKICGVKSALSALFSPRQNPCQIVSNDFGLISNFTRVSLGYFGTTLIFGLWIRVLKNREHN